MISWISAADCVDRLGDGERTGTRRGAGDDRCADLHPPAPAQLSPRHRDGQHRHTELDSGRHRVASDLTDPRAHPKLAIEEHERELPSTEHSRELVRSILHGAHAAQHRTDRRDVGHAEHAHDPPGRLPYRARHCERLGHPEAAVRDEHRGPFVGDLLRAVHRDLPPRSEEWSEQRHEVGVEAPLVDDVGAVDAAPDDVGERAHAASAECRCVTVAQS